MADDQSAHDASVKVGQTAAKKNKPAAKHTTKKRVKNKKSKTGKSAVTKTTARRPYPRASLEQAIRIPLAIKSNNGGNPWPPEEVAAAVGMSAQTPGFFYLAAASRDFGLTEGSRDSDLISLTEAGRDVVYAPSKEEENSALKTALLKIEIFRKVLEYYKGSNLPEMQYLGNTLVRDFDLDPAFHEEFSKLFRENCTFLNIGSGFSGPDKPKPANGSASGAARDNSTVVLAEPDEKTGLKCFAIMPFRERESARSAGFFDEVLRALIAPAGRDAGFEVLTANREGSDVIHATIVNQLLDADLVVADLTENNPNVLFELGLRIAEDKPIALIRSKGTAPIFDVDNMLRVYEYDPNLWVSTIDHDRPRLTAHIKAAWDHKDSNLNFMKILRERKTPKVD
jgi:hypothetical protein